MWNRLRYWPTRRRVLRLQGEYNAKTLRAEKTIVDKRPIWWLLGLLTLAIAPLFTPGDLQNTLLTAGATFGIYSAISLCWMLIMGTAGIFSLATYAVVGTAAFVTALLAIKFALPWWMLPPIGALVGLVFGGIIALPATRLDGFYYALLTLGLNELCRVYFVTSKEFGSANGGLYGAETYVPEDWSQLGQLLLAYYACFALMLLAPAALPLRQRPQAWTDPPHGARKARGVRRGDRGELSSGARLGVHHLVGRARLHRRILHRELRRRRIFDLQLRHVCCSAWPCW